MESQTLNEKIGYMKQEKGFASKAIHSGQSPDQWNSRAVVPPISLSTTFKQFAPAQHAGYEYSRSGNPTRKVLEDCLASLNNAKYAFVYPAGVATQTALLSLLSAGDHIISGDDIYGGTTVLFRSYAVKMGIDVEFVDVSDRQNVQNAFKPNTKMVWIESPTNPMMKIIDVASMGKLVHSQSKAIFVVDNTFLTPYFQQPLELGADVVMYSMSKYMNGHSDVLMGSAATNIDGIAENLRYFQNATGIIPSPFDCYLVNRSLKTLSLRMEGHSSNSYAIANYLNGHPKIEKVLHPSLKSHPLHELALKQSYGHSGIMSFYLANSNLEKSTKFLQSLKVMILCQSLGGPESKASIPALMAQADLPKEEKLKLGITDSLIRVSVGLEDIKDLLEDLEQALAVI